MKMLVYTGLSFALLLSFASIGFVRAQSITGITNVQIALTPEYPQPEQTVTATATVIGGNVRTGTVVWLLDDEVQQQGAGEVNFEFVAPPLGSSKTLSVLVQMPSGEVFTDVIKIAPAQTTLLWEANTYTPPYYKGRTRYTSGSLIRAQAISHFQKSDGTRYESNELLYTWSKNGTVLGNASGLAANTLVTEGPKFFGNYILEVKVTAPDGTQTSRSAARINTDEPTIKLYERDPLIGIAFHNAINNSYALSGASHFEIQAIPYFMSIEQPNDAALTYSWKVDGEDVVSQSEKPSVLTIQLSTDEELTTNLEVAVDHALHLLQTGRSMFTLGFESSARNSLFGL